MRMDKFGIGSLIIGVALVLGMLQFVFMPAQGWTVGGLVQAIIVAIEGGIILLGLFLALVGLLLLLL
jgi:hypothetical protein